MLKAKGSEIVSQNQLYFKQSLHSEKEFFGKIGVFISLLKKMERILKNLADHNTVQFATKDGVIASVDLTQSLQEFKFRGPKYHRSHCVP